MAAFKRAQAARAVDAKPPAITRGRRRTRPAVPAPPARRRARGTRAAAFAAQMRPSC